MRSGIVEIRFFSETEIVGIGFSLIKKSGFISLYIGSLKNKI